jgi:putative endonuclease
MAIEQNWHLYILACGDESLYVGITTDLEARLCKHSQGKGGRYTRSRLPVRLAASWDYHCDRSYIYRLERRVKALDHSKRMALVRGETDPRELV